MQDNEEKILANIVAELLSEIRLNTGKSLNLFCNEFSIPTSTLNDVENGKVNVTFFNLIKFLTAYNYDPIDFMKKVKEKLPEGFLTPEE